jgi:glycosyltransferase involved in cell wall biosynthesis
MSRDSRLRLAYFSPMPPARSGIADYSAELLPHLAQLADVTVFTSDDGRWTMDDSESSTVRRPSSGTVRPLRHYAPYRWQYDLALYQMGNSEHHDALYAHSLRYPGVVVLHDYILHHAQAHRTAGQGRPSTYVRELGYSYGPAGLRLAYRIQTGRQPMPLFTLPLNERLLHTNLGFIVHSQYVAERIRPQIRQRPLAVIPQIMTPPPTPPPPRQTLPGWPAHWPDRAVVLASAGQVTPARRLEEALAAFKTLSAAWPVYYLIIGDTGRQVDVAGLVAKLGLTERVHCTGYLPDLDQFNHWLAAADVVINLRHPTAGETSAVALRALALGKPLVVYNHGWYAELPAAVCYKLPLLDQSVLVAALTRLVADADERQALGETAVAYISHHCHPATVAQRYLTFLEQLLDFTIHNSQSTIHNPHA